MGALHVLMRNSDITLAEVRSHGRLGVVSFPTLPLIFFEFFLPPMKWSLYPKGTRKMMGKGFAEGLLMLLILCNSRKIFFKLFLFWFHTFFLALFFFNLSVSYSIFPNMACVLLVLIFNFLSDMKSSKPTLQKERKERSRSVSNMSGLWMEL